ncbi:RsiV family protein [Brackiella oedipodis]|uniref:RsiV family protein n=1 Tax=Brackiella oedipodis TaxID=124225 RepID=UPI0005718D89|nr:RsiV family protein [Brackiella oedipodis]
MPSLKILSPALFSLWMLSACSPENVSAADQHPGPHQNQGFWCRNLSISCQKDPQTASTAVSRAHVEQNQQSQAQISDIPLLRPKLQMVVDDKKCIKGHDKLKLGPDTPNMYCATARIAIDKTGLVWLDRLLVQDLTVPFLPDNEELSTTENHPAETTASNTETNSQASSVDKLAYKTAAYWLQSEVEWLEELRQDEIREQQKDKTYTAMGRGPYWYVNQARFLDQRQNLATFVHQWSGYTGGAHGIYGKGYSVFDLEQHKRLNLDDVLVPGQRPKLKALLREAFVDYRSQIGGFTPEEVESNNPDAYDNNNYYFGHDAMVFSYGPYALGSYADGIIELKLPYYSLQGILKSEYLPVEVKPLDN